jgi:hypothetical protein
MKEQISFRTAFATYALFLLVVVSLKMLDNTWVACEDERLNIAYEIRAQERLRREIQMRQEFFQRIEHFL